MGRHLWRFIPVPFLPVNISHLYLGSPSTDQVTFHRLSYLNVTISYLYLGSPSTDQVRITFHWLSCNCSTFYLLPGQQPSTILRIILSILLKRLGGYRSSYPVTLLPKLNLIMRRITELVCSTVTSSGLSTTPSSWGGFTKRRTTKILWCQRWCNNELQAPRGGGNY